MRTGLLRGRDHTLLGTLAALAEGPVAIALSRGGAAKTYAHRDPNEDAAAFAWSEHALLVAVADGHWGAEAAALVLARILEQRAPAWTAPGASDLAGRWREEAPSLALDLNRALLRARVGRTTLALGLWRPAEGQLLALAVGDSHLFHVGPGGARELCPHVDERACFLGDPRLEREHFEAVCRSVCEPTAAGALLLATDGLSESGIGVADPLGAAAESARSAGAAPAELRPLAAARRLGETALEAQRSQRAGDNVATACAWLEPDPGPG